MGTFAEVLSEATRRDVDDVHAASPFAHAVRAFEDRVAAAMYAASEDVLSGSRQSPEAR